MLKIKDNNLYLTRGDTAYLTVNFSTEREIESLVFSVKKKVADTDYVFQIEAVLDNKFIFTPALTKELEYGKYVYDIQLITTLGEVFTIVDKSFLYITDEVTE